MDFFRKSLIRKTFLILSCGLAGGVLMSYVFPSFPIPFIVLFLYFILALWTIMVIVHRPLSAIFSQMKALLTGHPYKKIFTTRIDEIGVLAHFFNEVTKHIERISVDIAEGRRMSKELSVGSDIQHKILPKEIPQIPGIAIFGNTRPASEVGGDSFDIIPSGMNTFMYTGDVTGHGLPAGLIMVMVNTLIRTLSETFSSGYDIIVNTNRILKQRIEPRRFMTCVLLRWNSQERKLYYTGAGHEHVLIFHKQSGLCEVKQTGGIALGMVPDISKIVKEEAISVEKGDFVVLYSDGIVEAKNIAGEMFGLKRLQGAVEQYARVATPEELFTNISKDFALFVGDQIQEDDITLITVKLVE